MHYENMYYVKADTYEEQHFFCILKYGRSIYKRLKKDWTNVYLQNELVRVDYRIEEYFIDINVDYDLMGRLEFFYIYLKGRVSEETAFALYGLIGIKVYDPTNLKKLYNQPCLFKMCKKS